MTIGPRTSCSLCCRNLRLDLGVRTQIMGVLNTTPDSFSDGGRFTGIASALDHARQMVALGADIIDVGGESSRPAGPYGQGAQPVSIDEEIRRTAPVIERLAAELPVAISIDTTKAEVARRALEAGAHIVNDISALRFDPAMADLVAEWKAPVVLMHMQGTPRTMQQNPTYRDLIGEIRAFLNARIETALRHGIARSQIVIDTGLGFGKRPEHNLELLARQSEFQSLGCPILAGPSRKQFTAPESPPNERLPGSLSALALCVAAGAHIVRVHDVREAAQAVALADRLRAVLTAQNSLTRPRFSA